VNASANFYGDRSSRLCVIATALEIRLLAMETWGNNPVEILLYI
jgi:hypothetical protein